MAVWRTNLDYNATAPLLPEARAAMLSALEIDANPSSVHAEGRRLRAVVENARAEVAALVGADPAGVIFTSGASEAAATLLTPRWRSAEATVHASRLYVGAADHPCVLSGGRFPPADIVVLPVDADGILDLGALAAALEAHPADTGVPLVATLAVNNETGVIQPLEAIAQMARRSGGLAVIDLVQAAGRVTFDLSASPSIDAAFISAHKIGGPKGAGAIVLRSSTTAPERLIGGGGQERGLRGGTENAAAIAGFGAAARVARERRTADFVRDLRDRFEAVVLDLVPDARIHGRAVPRVGNTTFFSLPRIRAETAQIAFDLEGISLSAGSACSSGRVGQSHVLKAMGADAALGALRISIGPETGEEALGAFASALARIVERHAIEARAA